MGEVLDYFDRFELWRDTALIVATDHGFLLGEHDWWAKNRMPLFEEISHIPLFIYHPEYSEYQGQRRKSLTQTIDLMPTILDSYGVSVPKEVDGFSLLPLLKEDKPLRSSAMFGYWGGGVNLTDGRYTYFCYPKDMLSQDLYQYTLMPTHMTKPFTVDELKTAVLVQPFKFTKDIPLLKIAHRSKEKSKTHSFHFPEKMEDTKTALYDLSSDPGQKKPIKDVSVTDRLNSELFRLMRSNDAPPESIRRMEESLLK